MKEKRVEYTYSCSNAMFIFLKDMDIDKLIADLKRIEQHAIDNDNNPGDKSLWFKFGSQDTLATDIDDIERDLKGVLNKEHTIENFKLVTEDLDPDKELQVYFS